VEWFVTLLYLGISINREMLGREAEQPHSRTGLELFVPL